MNKRTAITIRKTAAMLSPDPAKTKAFYRKLKREWKRRTPANRGLVRRGMKAALAEKAQSSSESA